MLGVKFVLSGLALGWGYLDFINIKAGLHFRCEQTYEYHYSFTLVPWRYNYHYTNTLMLWGYNNHIQLHWCADGTITIYDYTGAVTLKLPLYDSIGAFTLQLPLYDYIDAVTLQ